MFTGKGQMNWTLPPTPIPCLKYRSAEPSPPFGTRYRRQTGQIQMVAQTGEDEVYGAFWATMSLRITGCCKGKSYACYICDSLGSLKPYGASGSLVGFCPYMRHQELGAENFRTWSSKSSFNRVAKVSYIEHRNTVVPPIED